MSKVASKVAGRSGLLPKPRQIFKQPFKHESCVKQADTGYAEGILHPKNITREFVPPKVYTPAQRLKKSAKAPTREYKLEEMSKLTPDQQFKIKNSQMRRKYLEESYSSEVTKLNRAEKRAAEAKTEQQLLDAQKLQHEQSTAELFTIPTVESYLQGSLVRPRTEEEKDQLRLKRESNKLQSQLEVDTERAYKLLDLYNASTSFAITEEKLEKLVNDAFSNQATESQRELYSKSTWSEIDTSTYDNRLMETILDTPNSGAGFINVEDSLTGFDKDIKELAEQIQKERNEKQIEKAKDKASQFDHVKDKLNEEI